MQALSLYVGIKFNFTHIINVITHVILLVQATAQMPPQDAAACQNVPGSSLESEEAKTEQLSTQPTSTAKSTELQTAGEYGLQDTAANHSERPSEQGLGSLERLADTQEHASVVVDTSAVFDGLLPADELTDVQACGQQDAGASMQDESVTLVQHSVDQARLQSALASTEQIPIYEDPEVRNCSTVAFVRLGRSSNALQMLFNASSMSRCHEMLCVRGQ